MKIMFKAMMITLNDVPITGYAVGRTHTVSSPHGPLQT